MFSYPEINNIRATNIVKTCIHSVVEHISSAGDNQYHLIFLKKKIIIPLRNTLFCIEYV